MIAARNWSSRAARLAAALVQAAAALILAGAADANVVISTAATSNMDCSGGVCTATAANAVLNANDLQNLLDAGNTTVATGSLAASIVVGAPFGWASSSTLTLDARRSIAVNKAVTDNGTGGLIIFTNDGGSGGTFGFASTGSLSFFGTSNAVTINTVSYTLVNSVSALAAAIAGNPSGNYALANSYNATPDGTYAHSPVATAYAGNLQGFGNTISHLTILDSANAENVGLFAAVQSGGSIQNLRLTSESVGSGSRKSIGGVAGLNAGLMSNDSVAGVARGGEYSFVGELVGTNNGTISSCHASGTVRGAQGGLTGPRALGGLVGLDNTTIQNSDASVNVTGSTAEFAGGLIGEVGGTANASVSGSFAIGTVSGASDGDAGGLIGQVDNTIYSASVTNSYATGNVSNGFNSGGLIGAIGNVNCVSPCAVISYSHATGQVSGVVAGGLVGLADSPISDSYATGAVTATGDGGGLVGAGGFITGSFATGNVSAPYAGGLVGFGADVTNSYATGDVSNATSYGGGLMGQSGSGNGGSITTSFATGTVSGGKVGGFLGYNRDGKGGNLADDYWDTTTSGLTQGVGRGISTGVTGLSTTQLQSGLPSGFDPSAWAESPSINGGLPYLIANPPS